MVEEPAEILRNHGMRVTAQRLAVLRAVAAHPHAAAADVAEHVRGDIGTISRQAVYDCLAALTDQGILRLIQPAGSPARYETRFGAHHHHLVCRGCDQMVDVDGAVGDAPRLTPVDDWHLEIDGAEVIYWGTCPECQMADA